MYGSRARGCGEWIRWKNRRGGRVFRYHLGWCVLVYRIVLLFTCLGLSKDNVVHNKVLTRLWSHNVMRSAISKYNFQGFSNDIHDGPQRSYLRNVQIDSARCTIPSPSTGPVRCIKNRCITFVRPEVIAVDLNLHLNLGIKPIWTLSHVHVLCRVRENDRVFTWYIREQ